MVEAPVNPQLESRLKRLARGRVALPFETADYSAAEFRRGTLRLSLCLGAVLVLSLGGLLVAVGLVPWIHRDETVTAPEEAWILVLAMAFGVPVVTALLFYAWRRWHFRGVSDEDGRPWRYRATETDFSIARSDGLKASGAWARWAYRRCDYSEYQGNLAAITSLEIAFDGFPITLDLTRLRRGVTLSKVLLGKLRPAP